MSAPTDAVPPGAPRPTRPPRRHEDRLGDFTTNARLLVLTPMAAVVGVISALVAVALVWLIGAALTAVAFMLELTGDIAVLPAADRLRGSARGHGAGDAPLDSLRDPQRLSLLVQATTFRKDCPEERRMSKRASKTPATSNKQKEAATNPSNRRFAGARTSCTWSAEALTGATWTTGSGPRARSRPSISGERDDPLAERAGGH